MYASQLLRILETFPKNVNDEFYDFAAVEPVEAMKESPRRYTNPFLSDEENEKINLWNNQEIERLNMGGDLTTNYDEDKLKIFVAPSDLCEKETELYTDKNVTECELPELLVCYKDGAFQVKDICVDDGIPKGESILFDESNNEILKPEQLRFTPLEDFYMESKLCSGTIGKIDTHIPVFEPTINHMDNGENRDEVIETKSDASSGSQEVDLDKDCKDAATEQVIFNSMPSLQQDQNQPLPSLKSLLESIDNQHSYQSFEELTLKRSVVQTTISNESTTEENNTLNLHNHKAATSSGVHEVENPEHVNEPSIEPQGVPKDHDIGSDNVTMMNPVCRGSEGESSFSVAGPVSGLITYSGPIAFSGSISLRSDSSTTSTRSFAFPILQNEWNSSPVRMAKADRRRLQKHRGWRHGLLCCRF